MNLDELLRARPLLHEDAEGQPHSWQLGSKALAFIAAHVQGGSRTLEIGAGVSTVLFALKGARHTCIVPYEKEVARIKAFCAEHRISVENVTFEVDFSERCLPRLDPTELDLVLIDGAHGFPAPFLDWYYTAERLKVGGLLVIDDTQLWTGHVLRLFLSMQPEWKLEADFPPQSVIFSKVQGPVCSSDHTRQPYVIQESLDLMFRVYPQHAEWARWIFPADEFRAKERTLAYRRFRARQAAQAAGSRAASVARSVASLVLPEFIKRSIKKRFRGIKASSSRSASR